MVFLVKNSVTRFDPNNPTYNKSAADDSNYFNNGGRKNVDSNRAINSKPVTTTTTTTTDPLGTDYAATINEWKNAKRIVEIYARKTTINSGNFIKCVKIFGPITGGAHIRTGQKTFLFISGRARNFWTALIGRALQKQNKKDKIGRATHISGPSLYATAPVAKFVLTHHARKFLAKYGQK